MRPGSDVEVEAWVLTTESGRALLDEVGEVRQPGPGDLARWRKGATAAQVAAALRLTLSRARGTVKFARADRMWLDPVGLEQSTAEPVAHHKARRFAGRLVVDLCAGLGGDSLAMAAAGARVLAVDADEGMCRRLKWNAKVYDLAGQIAPVRARAEAFPIPTEALVHVDPDRRVLSDRRAPSVRAYVPGLEFLLALVKTAEGGALKLGPASDFATYFGGPEFEIELISLAGECKEATVWFGRLATCRRRATRLPDGATWTDRDGPTNAYATVAPLGRWIYEPDPALSRSGLVDSFAVVHRLGRAAAGIDYLTGETPIDSPFLAMFEVIASFPLDVKTLRREVAERGLGPLEIKMRGLDLKPETLRKELRLRGTTPATLLLMGGPGPARAVLALRSPVTAP
jgi:hypothetical protein